MKSFLHFIKESIGELHKMTWPTQQTTMQYSLIVIVSVIIFVAFFGVIDYVLSEIVTNVLIGG